MTFLLAVLGVLGAAEVVRLEAARVVSGQRVCLGDPQRPCYKIAYFHAVSSRVSFVEAREACQMDGGSLLSIESAGEQSDIQHLLQALRLGAAEMAGGGGSIADGDFWIGLRRVDGDERTRAELGGAVSTCPQLYQWSDGSAAAFRNWYSDEPSCGGEACVVMYHQPTAAPGLGGAYLYQWNDDRCNMKHNFICKEPPADGARRHTWRATRSGDGGRRRGHRSRPERPPKDRRGRRFRDAAAVRHHSHNPPAAAHPDGCRDLLLPDVEPENPPHQDRRPPLQPVDSRFTQI